MQKKKWLLCWNRSNHRQKNHDPSIPVDSKSVKLKIGDLQGLRSAKGLFAKDMVEVVQRIYPKYDKMIHSKCEHGSEYGIQLRPDALRTLYQHFAPEMLQHKPRQPNRTNSCRIQARLSTDTNEQFRAALSEDGITIQSWIEKQISEYLQSRKDNT